MHELSIVLNIIEMAENEAKKEGASVIQSIEIEIGRLSTIEPEAFEFAWQQGIKATMLENAVRKLHYREGKGKCLECGREFRVENLFDECPDCKSYLTEIIEGKELRINNITIN